MNSTRLREARRLVQQMDKECVHLELLRLILTVVTRGIPEFDRIPADPLEAYIRSRCRQISACELFRLRCRNFIVPGALDLNDQFD
ncbi:hypothetical protein GA0115237_102246 [Streptomyces sp. ScaeMP-6W]|nr:hypothetical protein GA0115237_102246 [Streptomyces sp. ScaeMP-6W]